MRALPARRIATSALCAALLVGITGPAAMAADSTREHSRVLSSEARLRGADVLIAQVRTYNRGELAPVADLLKAAAKADNGQLPAAEAKKLGAEAKRALDKAADKAPATGAERRVLERRAADLTDDELDELNAELDDELNDELDDVEEAIDDLLESISDDVDEVLSLVDDLLAEVEDLLDELLDGDLPETTPSTVSTLTSTSLSTSVPLEPTVTLPAITSLTPVLVQAP
ncbi:hypothetical protein AB0D57_41080 [Streptomyces sp. NPDC048275]|uniref:hypothetical protein n=1 Tax=Streptomyces sp. NPDC048275 TaxID=3155629 RepID=UPI0033D06623